MNNRFINKEAPKDFRLIAVSDIHGGADLLIQLLDKVSLRDEDYLVILGDSILKSGDSIATLEYLKQLVKRPNTYILAGNCERYIAALLTKEENAEDLVGYARERPHTGVIEHWMESLGLDAFKVENPIEFQRLLFNGFKEDIEFLDSLPLALEFDDFIFVHAGIDPIEDWKESAYETLLYCSSFLDRGHTSSKYVVAGHWPVSNYRKQSLNNQVLIDHKKKIIAIDGGNAIKSFGQINALIINKKNNNNNRNNKNEYCFSSEFLDRLKECRVVKSVNMDNEPIVKLNWQDNAVALLEEGKEFSLCRKLSTNELVKVKNELLVKAASDYKCKIDYVSLFLNVKEGETVKLAGEYGEYILAKANNGELGWIHKQNIQMEHGKEQR